MKQKYKLTPKQELLKYILIILMPLAILTIYLMLTQNPLPPIAR